MNIATLPTYIRREIATYRRAERKRTGREPTRAEATKIVLTRQPAPPPVIQPRAQQRSVAAAIAPVASLPHWAKLTEADLAVCRAGDCPDHEAPGSRGEGCWLGIKSHRANPNCMAGAQQLARRISGQQGRCHRQTKLLGSGLRPRLVHVFPWDLSIGGAQRMLDSWCKVDANRWETTIISSGPHTAFQFPNATVYHSLSKQDATTILESLQPDVLVHHGPTSGFGHYVKCPNVWILHAMSVLQMPAPMWGRPAFVFSNLDSPSIHSSWRELPLRFLPLGVDLEWFRPCTDLSSVPRPLVCGIVGRISREKVPMHFVRALKTWNPGPWIVRFVGNGSENDHQPWVRMQLKDLSYVEFVGDVTPHRVPNAMGQLDALLVPTEATWGETGCYSAVEAMACGIPVVGRDVEGLRASCGEAALYAESDEGLLAELRNLDNKQLRAQLSQVGRQIVERGHDVKVHVAEHSRVFASALPVEVSVLTPAWNTPARFLREFWDSLRLQTCRAWELVLVDDGSAMAETVAELDRISEDPRVHLIRTKHQGISAALNAGLKACRSDLVARMDADDVMLPERLAHQLAFMWGNPTVGILGAQIEIFNDVTGAVLSRTSHPAIIDESLALLQANTGNVWILNHPAVMFRRDVISGLGGYPNHQVSQDPALWLTALRAGVSINNMAEVLVRYRVHGAQQTARPEHVVDKKKILAAFTV